MYQAGTIDTTQISAVNVNSVTTLPEVPAESPVIPTRTQSSTNIQTSNSGPAAPITTSAIELSVSASTNEWPSIDIMVNELQASGMLNPELGVPLAMAATAPKDTPSQPPKPDASMITLANTTVSFERPSAEYILHQPEAAPKLSGWLVTTGIGLIVIIGIVVLMYINLLNQGLTQAEIMQTALDALQLSQ